MAETRKRGRAEQLMVPVASTLRSGDNMPMKRLFRQRAHCNPLSHHDSFVYPNGPDDMRWGDHFTTKPSVDVVDVGCGFGGLTVALAAQFPELNVLGMEIRTKVTDYVHLRIRELRRLHPGQFGNAAVFRSNVMKYFSHFFARASLSKLFFCFPDPHFKAKNHRRRIISQSLLAQYAHALRVGGRLYTITDVEDLHQWMASHCDRHPLLRRLSEEEMRADPAVAIMFEETEEAKKVARGGGEKMAAVYERVEGPAGGEGTWEEFWGEGA